MSFEKEIQAVAGKFQLGRQYSLGEFAGLSPDGQLVFAVRQGEQSFANFVNPLDKDEVEQLLSEGVYREKMQVTKEGFEEMGEEYACRYLAHKMVDNLPLRVLMKIFNITFLNSDPDVTRKLLNSRSASEPLKNKLRHLIETRMVEMTSKIKI